MFLFVCCSNALCFLPIEHRKDQCQEMYPSIICFFIYRKTSEWFVEKMVKITLKTYVNRSIFVILYSDRPVNAFSCKLVVKKKIYLINARTYTFNNASEIN